MLGGRMSGARPAANPARVGVGETFAGCNNDLRSLPGLDGFPSRGMSQPFSGNVFHDYIEESTGFPRVVYADEVGMCEAGHRFRTGFARTVADGYERNEFDRNIAVERALAGFENRAGISFGDQVFEFERRQKFVHRD